MSEKKVQWYMGNMLAKFDVERAAWTSVQAPTDFNHAEFLLTPDEFPSLDGEQARWLGTVELVIKGSEGDTVHIYTPEMEKSVEADEEKIRVTYSENTKVPGIRIVEEYLRSDDGIRWDISVENTGNDDVELERLGIPLLMNQFFRGDDQFKYEQCVLRHTCLCHENSWIYWEKSSGEAPLLILKTMDDTALDCFETEHRFAEHTGVEGAFEGLYTVYVYHEPMPDHRFENLEICTLKAGQTIQKSFMIGMQQSREECVQWLVRNGGFYLESVPGMVLPYGKRAELTIYSKTKPSIKSDYAEDMAEEVEGKAGTWKAYLTLNGYGRRGLAVTVDGHLSRLTFFGIENPGEIYAEQTDFIIKNQFETDDTDPCYHALLMWDMDVKHRINSKCNPHGPDWFAGGSDEIGLVTGLFLSEWNAYHPKEEQVRVLQEYCHDFIEQRLTEQPGWRVHRMVPWFVMFEPWNGRGADDVWRAFNYVHVINTYYNMYRISRIYHRDWLDAPHVWIYKAYEYAKAMFSYWMFPDGIGATEIGNMGEFVLATEIVGALKDQNCRKEADELQEIITEKARFFAGKTYPYGSEMAYDSTAYEAVYGYGKAIMDERVMEKTMEVSLANRGWQPEWYLYMTDLRGGGDSHWNVSYMTQLGAYPIYDWVLEQRHYQVDLMKALYGAYLAGFAIYNSGGYWSDEPENQGATAWIFHGVNGLFTGKDRDGAPVYKGIVAMSGEGCLGFFGALKIAASMVYQEDGQQKALGGQLFEKEGGYVLKPDDGLNMRFFDTCRDFAVKLEQDTLESIETLENGWMIRIKNDTDVSHTLRMEVRSGIGEEYQIITEKGYQTQKIEREWAWIEVELLPGTQSVEILQ